jgi:hypothetical protein
MTAMSAWELTAADEGRHTPGPEELWGESWYLDWCAPDGGHGGYVRLGFYPNLGVAWWWVAVVEASRGPVIVMDHSLPVPAEGLAVPDVELMPGAGFADFGVRADSEGVRHTRPSGPLHGDAGEPVPVRVDLTWHAAGPPFPYAMTTRYELSCTVRGTVTVAGREIPVDGPGQRDHSWGWRDWWMFPWSWTSGRLADGRAFHAARSLLPDALLFATGYVLDPDGRLAPSDEVEAEPQVDDERLVPRSRHRIGGLDLQAEALAHAPLLLVADDGRTSAFARSLCRFSDPAGVTGVGWCEWNQPRPPGPPGGA